MIEQGIPDMSTCHSSAAEKAHFEEHPFASSKVGRHLFISYIPGFRSGNTVSLGSLKLYKMAEGQHRKTNADCTTKTASSQDQGAVS